ncbi:hypothetical protein [Williamsia sp.]|uniref:hypothetical protein n=1 Tax=Williamsia sp. TaxID=1872085 RepID=UPI002F92E31E
MFWILVSVGVVVISSLMLKDGDGLDFRGREVRNALARRNAEEIAQMRKIRRARRRQNLIESLRRARATTPAVARA